MIGTILLDKQDKYVDDFGNLPEREHFDKDFLLNMLKGTNVSQEGYNILPKSMRDVVSITQDEPFPVTIPEINYLSDLLLVVRSKTLLSNGKVFRLDNFRKLTTQGSIELWVRK